jgi:tRNA threonylcarbamoyladenosine biosynthesis protein TsaE
MKITTKGEADTRRYGEELGRALRGGTVIELIGDVGAGKTTLVKGIAVGLGIDEDVQSPTFTISRVYEADRGLRLAHYDFYRLNDPGIMREELAEMLQDPETVTIIEWADTVKDVLPVKRMTIRMSSPSEDERELDITEGKA